MVDKRVIPHQKALRAFFPFFGHLRPVTSFAYGVMTPENEVREHMFSTAIPEDPALPLSCTARSIGNAVEPHPAFKIAPSKDLVV